MLAKKTELTGWMPRLSDWADAWVDIVPFAGLNYLGGRQSFSVGPQHMSQLQFFNKKKTII